jgi:hypothetical protein
MSWTLAGASDKKVIRAAVAAHRSDDLNATPADRVPKKPFRFFTQRAI